VLVCRIEPLHGTARVRQGRRVATKVSQRANATDTVRSTWLRSLSDRMLYEVPVGCRWRVHFVDEHQISHRRRWFGGPDLDYRLTEKEFLSRFERPGRYWFEPMTPEGKRIARVLAYYERPPAR
jgi:hypothetical protein